jgi:hypothetical protein
VNVPFKRVPFAWAGRKPGCSPKIVSNCLKQILAQRDNLLVRWKWHMFIMYFPAGATQDSHVGRIRTSACFALDGFRFPRNPPQSE